MAAANSAVNVAKTLGVDALKDAGISSLQIGLAAGVTVFAIQAAVVAGKALLASGKVLAKGLKA